MTILTKHYVTFYSPGTFFDEVSAKEIASWDVMLALEMSRSILERYDAKPYAFAFSTRTRGDNDFDSKETASSKRYYINGKIETLEEITARNDPREEILRSNMRINKWPRVVVTETPWRHVGQLSPGDIVLDANGKIIHTEPAR